VPRVRVAERGYVFSQCKVTQLVTGGKVCRFLAAQNDVIGTLRHSRRRSNSVAFGAKRTSAEPMSTRQLYRCGRIFCEKPAATFPENAPVERI
jgi:hypothetical protein